MRREFFIKQEEILNKKKARLEVLGRDLEKFSHYSEKNKKCVTDGKAVLIAVFAMLEMFTIIATGMGALNCWFS